MSTILLVDDEVDSLWVFQLVLEGRGYHVILAENGDAALAKASRWLPDLIVTDWNMPGTDGIELCQRLKFYPALAQIPVVMSSGHTPPAEKSKLWNVFIPKPVELEELESVIDSLLAKRLDSPHHGTNVPAPAPSRWQPVPWKLWV
ncbi:response regulator [Paraburkholderia phenazinium]|uniref:Response regulator receiver domain-containing protein n=1 Tax=Paraburkholderia phenazinium TaxID=60549 RepID=A0A1G7X8A1_9BURK|nr:response regulator [Paraburkholderia phenazinium]SDG80357.1 Response regulator receiver domain-containing protein [Paraburkholderia phenazinium]